MYRGNWEPREWKRGGSQLITEKSKNVEEGGRTREVVSPLYF